MQRSHKNTSYEKQNQLQSLISFLLLEKKSFTLLLSLLTDATGASDEWFTITS